ncbi:hypothetical protein GCM10010495_77660 [Kitasatospora herbaricolor]|nr:hypothetical protein GCM10010495_77660 [Kitasatospora herbaricolor]
MGSRGGYLVTPDDLDESRHCYDCRTDDCEYHDYRADLSRSNPGPHLGAQTVHPQEGRRTGRQGDRSRRKAVKTDPDSTLWWVKSIRAVGPYAEPGHEPLLHIDLAVDLRPRLADASEQRNAEQRLCDAARDRGERERVWDMTGYGHWHTRIALAGAGCVQPTALSRIRW